MVFPAGSQAFCAARIAGQAETEVVAGVVAGVVEVAVGAAGKCRSRLAIRRA